MKQFFLVLILILSSLTASPKPTHAAGAYATAGTWNSDVAYHQGWLIFGGTLTSWTFQYGANYARTINGNVHLGDGASTTNFTFKFKGQRVTYWYSKAYNRGNVRILIDGVEIETISACTPEPHVMRQIGRTWTVPLKTSGPIDERDQHELKVESVGPHWGCTKDPTLYPYYMDMDAFSVDIVSNGLIPYGGSFSHMVSGYNDSDTNVKFSPGATNPGEWYIFSPATGAFQNDNRNHNQQQLFFRFISNQPRAAIVYSKANNRGKMEITIDGESKAVIDQYSATTARQLIQQFDNLHNTSLPAGVVIDTHIIHGYVRGEPTGSSTFVDIDRIDLVEKKNATDPWPTLFNTSRAGYILNKGVRASIPTADPVLRPNAVGSWSWVRVFSQRLSGSNLLGFCEIGHMKDGGFGHRAYWTRVDPNNSLAFGVLGPALTIGSTNLYTVQVSTNASDSHECTMWATIAGITYVKTTPFAYSSVDSWGAGAETSSPNHGIGPAYITGLQHKSASTGNWVNQCTAGLTRDVSFYDLLGTCADFTVTGNNF